MHRLVLLGQAACKMDLAKISLDIPPTHEANFKLLDRSNFVFLPLFFVELAAVISDTGPAKRLQLQGRASIDTLLHFPRPVTHVCLGRV